VKTDGGTQGILPDAFRIRSAFCLLPSPFWRLSDKGLPDNVLGIESSVYVIFLLDRLRAGLLIARSLSRRVGRTARFVGQPADRRVHL
jgi:hypothetical protein